MITFKLNGLEVQAEQGSTILDVARFYGLEIPTLCYMEGLDPWGGCRLCVVEIGEVRQDIGRGMRSSRSARPPSPSWSPPAPTGSRKG